MGSGCSQTGGSGNWVPVQTDNRRDPLRCNMKGNYQTGLAF